MSRGTEQTRLLPVCVVSRTPCLKRQRVREGTVRPRYKLLPSRTKVASTIPKGSRMLFRDAAVDVRRHICPPMSQPSGAIGRMLSDDIDSSSRAHKNADLIAVAASDANVIVQEKHVEASAAASHGRLQLLRQVVRARQRELRHTVQHPTQAPCTDSRFEFQG